MRELDEIARLARRFEDRERNLVLYFPDFGAPAASETHSRVFGHPTGLSAVQWPHLGHGPRAQWMEHVLTLDLRDLKLPTAPAGARVVMLFRGPGPADRPGTPNTAVIFLGDADLRRRGAAEPSQIPVQRRSRRFGLRSIAVPGDVFDRLPDDDTPLRRLQDAIWKAPARIGGRPLWLREPSWVEPAPDEPPAPVPGLLTRPSFLMQFDARFADIALGNRGVMYVFGTTAYYQDVRERPRPPF